MTHIPEWQEFRRFRDRGAAEALCARLRLEEVPTMIETRSLEQAVEAEYVVLVGAELAHRARWIAAQLPPSDAELNFLATGKLPGEE